MRAKKTKKFMPSKRGSQSTEGKGMMGYSPPQHQYVVPRMGEGPRGNVGVLIPYGDAPKCPEPPVGAGKGFKGW